MTALRKAIQAVNSFKVRPKAFLRAIALSVALIYTFEQTGIAETGLFPQSFSGASNNNLQMALPEKNKTISIPFLKNIATVSGAYQGKGTQLVIQIEDAHQYHDAQLQISETLKRLNLHWKVRKVGIEGASGELLHRLLSSYPDSSARKMLGEYYLEEGLINGAEYAALTDSAQLDLIGMEDPKTYQRNRLRFLKGLKTVSGAKKQLELAGGVLEMLSSRIFSKETRQLRKEQKRYAENRSNFLSYASYLIAEADRLNLNAPYPHIKKAVRLMKSIASRRSQRDSEELQNALSMEIFTEMEKLELSVMNSCLKTQDERELDYWLNILTISKKLLSYELTEKEAIFFEKNRPDFRSTKLKTGINRLIKKHAPSQKTRTLSWDLIDRGIHQSASFYRFALKRDRVLAENTLRLLNESRHERIAVVTGGFHTAGIQRILKSRGVSYITLRPKIQQLESDASVQKRYLAEMKQEGVFFDTLFQLQTPRRFPTTVSQSPAGITFLRSSVHVLMGLSAALGSPKSTSAIRHSFELSHTSPTEKKWAAEWYHAPSYQQKATDSSQGVLAFPNGANLPDSYFYWGDNSFELGLPKHAPIQLSTSDGRTFYYSPRARSVGQHPRKVRSELRTPTRTKSFSSWTKTMTLSLFILKAAVLRGADSPLEAAGKAAAPYKVAAEFNLFRLVDSTNETAVPVLTTNTPPAAPAQDASPSPIALETPPARKLQTNIYSFVNQHWNRVSQYFKNHWQFLKNELSTHETPLLAWITSPILHLPIWLISLLGLTGYAIKARGVRGATAHEELEAAANDVRQLDEDAAVPPHERTQALREHLDQQFRLDELEQTMEPPQSSFWGIIFTLALESLSIAIPIALYFIGGLSPFQVLGVFAAARIGMNIGSVKNEWGHIAAAVLAGHGSTALNLRNLTGNRTWAWLIKMLPLGSLFAPPYVLIKDTPSQAQAEFIRKGGYWISLVMLVAAVSAWYLFPLGIFPAFTQSLLPDFFIIGMISALSSSFASDWLVKNTNPRFFLCGNFVFFLPIQTNFWQSAVEIFKIVRILSLRGTDGIGMVSWYDLRSKSLLTTALTVILTGIFTAALITLSMVFTWTIAWWLFPLLSLLPALVIAWWMTKNLEPGAISDRIRTLNTKRVDISMMLLTSLLMRTLIIYIFAGRKAAWTLVTGHVRRATSSPNPRATQPQTWVHTSLWNLIFKRTRILYLTPDGFELRQQWAEPTVGHNGDLNGVHFKVFKKEIMHNPDKHSKGDLHNYLDVSLAQENNDEGDTVNASGMMKKMIVQGNFRGALLLAYEQVILDGKQPTDWALSPKDLGKLTREFEKEFLNRRNEYFHLLNGSRRNIALESVPDDVLKQIAADLLKKFARNRTFASLVPKRKQAAFLEYAVTALFRNNVLEAMKHYATKINPYDTAAPWMGGADGTHGLVVTSPAYNSIGLYKKGQPLTVGFTEDYTSFSVFSSGPLVNDGRLRYSLELYDDEICYLYWDEHGTVQFVIYNVVESRNIPAEELQQKKRIVDLEKIPDAPKMPDPLQMFPIDDHVAQIADVAERAADSVLNSQDQNFHTLDLLTNHLDRLQAYRNEHGHLPDGAHVLLVGNMPHEASMELARNALHDLYPDLKIEIWDSDEAARVIVNYLEHPAAALSKLRITPNTLLIPFSHSGEAFDTSNVLLWLCTQVEHVMPILGDRANEMARLVGPGRVLSNGVGSLRMTEVNTHATTAMDILVLAAVLETAKRLQARHGMQTVLGGHLQKAHIDRLHRGLETLTQRLPSITGYDSEGKKVTETLPRRQLLKLGRKIARYSHETFFSAAATAFTVGALVALSIAFFPSQLLGPFTILSFKFAGILILNGIFAYFLNKIAARTLRMVGFYRKLLKRTGSPTIHFHEESTALARRIELLGDQTVSLGYENAPKIKGEATSKANRRLTPTRGDVVISIERFMHASDKGSDSMNGRQTLGPRTDQHINEATEYYGIGHGKPQNPMIYNEYIDLFEYDNGRIVHGYPEIQDVTGEALPNMRDFMSHFLQVERDVARFVWFNEHATSLAFPGTRHLLKQWLLKVPYLKWPVYLFINRFPWVTRFYPYWHAHGGVLYPTTASTRDMSPVQTWVTQHIQTHGEAGWKLQKLPKHPSLAQEIPTPMIPDDVYSPQYPPVHAPLIKSAKPLTRNAAPAPLRSSVPEPHFKTHARQTAVYSGNGNPARRNTQLEMQQRYVTSLIQHLDADLEAGRNGNVPHLLEDALSHLEYMDTANFDRHIVHGYKEAVKERLQLEDDAFIRAELRLAVASKERVVNGFLIDAAHYQFQRLLTRMKAQGLNASDAALYFTTQQQSLLGIQDTTLQHPSGAYILTDFYEIDPIQRILSELPPQIPLILFLDAANSTHAQRLDVIRSFAREIKEGTLIIPRSELRFQSLVARESKKRNLEPSQILEFSTGLMPVTAEESSAVSGLLAGAARLTESQLVIVNAKSRLDKYQARHFSLPEIYETMLASAEAVAISA